MARSATESSLPDQHWWTYLDRHQWKAFFAAWLGVLLDGYDFVLISFALPAIITTFNLSLVQGAALISAAFISRWAGGLILGAVGDRFGRKPAMVLSIFLFAGASIAMALAPWYWFLFVCRLLIGFAMAGEYSSSATYVIESWPRHMRNKASGFLLSGYAFGVVLAAQVDKFLVPAVERWHAGWGWRALFLTGIVPIVVAVYMRRTLPEATDWVEAKADNDSASDGDMLSILFRGKHQALNYIGAVAAGVLLLMIFGGLKLTSSITVLLAIVITAIFIAFIYQFDSRRWITGVAIMLTIFASFMYTWPIQGLLPTYLKGVGMNADTVANIVSIAGIGNAIGYIVAGFMGDAFGMRKWYATSLVISQTIVFPLFMQGGKYVVLVGALLFFNQMFGQGISGLLPKWVSSYFPVERRAAGLGFCYNVGALGGAVGPVIGASLASTYSLGAALAVLSVGFAAVVVLSIGLNIPRLLQRAVDASAVRPEDGDDELIARS
ncbi:MFS transporter [Actinomyces radicidentis]|uniref:MFS transporter n=1 Tax=Actinomyces radicidentis TaxID=111015 RepID=UPI0026DFE77A|nr:MFS transporter [Actinomyces radicidentis]